MTLDQVFKLVYRARALTHHRDLVVVGSNSILGLAEHTRIPDDMVISLDLDSYLKNDPGRTGDLKAELGEGSHFHRKEGFYLDPVSPSLPTLPEGWETRLLPVERDECRAWFIDPDDAAISKYARGEPRDVRWIRSGLAAGIISLPKVKHRFTTTLFLDEAEQKAVRMRIEADEKWLQPLQASRRKRGPPAGA